MVNGSLEEWLHPTHTVAGTIERPRSLCFSQRLTIAIDVSLALDYLHHHSGTLIVHCDIKPSNVLLNDDMVAPVSDFGLVRFLYELLVINLARWSERNKYGTGHEVWTQGDVYSYGILLREMFTGKRPTDDMFEGASNLHNFVKAALAEHVIEIVDPVLVEEKPEGEIIEDTFLFEDSIRPHSKIEESLTSILEIGVACSAELPRERSDISDVVCEMNRIRNKLGETSELAGDTLVFTSRDTLVCTSRGMPVFTSRGTLVFTSRGKLVLTSRGTLVRKIRQGDNWFSRSGRQNHECYGLIPCHAASDMTRGFAA
ncbi:hypothetical protein ACLB2K_077097 [Fragaria x ananassa]